jgi:hypothetical protein
MGPNPYRLADRRQRAARARVASLTERLAFVLPILGTIGAVWLARDVYDAQLGGPPDTWSAGFTGVLSRIGLLLTAGLALSTYDAVIRGPDRGVVDLHPLLPRPWLAARLLALSRDRAAWLLPAGIALAPLWPRTDALLLGFVVLVGAWCAGIGVGLGVNLAAPSIGRAPAMAGVLDALRGQNPRLQAALLYAPGVALAIAGSATLLAAAGAGLLLEGDLRGVLGLAGPFVAAAFGLALADRAAPEMSSIGAILGEIEAAWALADTAEEARAVYLEWLVPRMPGSLRLPLLKELRHLWRGHRGWVTGSWGLALLSGLAGWTDASDGPQRLAQVGAASLALFAAVGVPLGAKDPRWLVELLPVPGRRPARVLALFACMQVILIAGVLSLGVRQGTAALLPLLRLEGVAVAVALASTWAGDRLRERGLAVYAPAALLVWSIGGAS